MTIAFATLSSVKRTTYKKDNKKCPHSRSSSITYGANNDDTNHNKQEFIIDQDEEEEIEEDFYSNEKSKFSKKFKKSFLFPWSTSSSTAPAGYHHGRRSSISAFFQSFCGDDQPIFDSRRRRSTSSFANDALFERYRYRKQTLSNNKLDLSRKPASAPPSSLPAQRSNDDELILTNSNNPLTPSTTITDPILSSPPLPPVSNNNSSNISGTNTPRVVCWQDDNVPPGILVNHHQNRHNRQRHKHTTSLQCNPSFNNQNQQLGPLHRRSKSTAATHVRHYSHVSYISSSNITAHSEDLTTKEFADLVGIKILDEDDDHHENNNDSNTDEQTTTHTTPWFFDDNNNSSSIIHNQQQQQQHHQRDDNVSLDEECLSVKSSGLSIINKQPTIWDDAFWKTTTAVTQDSTVTTATTTSTKSIVEGKENKNNIPSLSRQLPQLPEPPLPQQQQPLPKTVVPSLSTPQRKVIKKGRFEIHVESAA
ncbi:hypothetical protein INT45_007470 [Circinella minor]|uniref:Uncharacterized protein n=1 Tax=Circinella minor TaxID=1195481 RepID=A0A8H7SF68_9FUNG|nr:hypothetical protein INT45_007470 [Circinella minor]